VALQEGKVCIEGCLLSKLWSFIWRYRESNRFSRKLFLRPIKKSYHITYFK